MTTTRRNFIAKSVLTAAGVTAGLKSGLLKGASSADPVHSSPFAGTADNDAFKICIFS
ncbi:MAG: twin-arginine translocation signal domain-containing protein, partial [Bacteroidia bacterium]|nr:twin-arginine translocation signal domain-containing protein [Bacteroidia bacterium]